VRLLTVLLTLMLFAALLFPGISHACGGDCVCEEGSCLTVDIESPDTAKESLKKAYPNLTFESVGQTGIDGIFEVVAGSNILYFVPNGGYLIFGEIFKNGKSITAKRKTELAAAKLKDLPLDKAVKIGDGKNIVIEVADPDCPYCRKAHEFLKDRTDVTRYVFMYPLPSHPKAPIKAELILCSSNQPKIFDEVMEGKWDGFEEKIVSCEKGEKLLREHKRISEGLGVRGTPAFWINNVFVKGANIAKIKELLEKGGER